MQVTSTHDTLTKDEWHESIALWLRDCGIKKNYPTGCGIKKKHVIPWDTRYKFIPLAPKPLLVMKTLFAICCLVVIQKENTPLVRLASFFVAAFYTWQNRTKRDGTTTGFVDTVWSLLVLSVFRDYSFCVCLLRCCFLIVLFVLLPFLFLSIACSTAFVRLLCVTALFSLFTWLAVQHWLLILHCCVCCYSFLWVASAVSWLFPHFPWSWLAL